VIKQVRYTNPLTGEQITHNVECSDTETLANGQPKPNDDIWLPTFEDKNSFCYEIL